METIVYEWKTFEDEYPIILKLNSDMFQFLVESNIEIHSLNLEINLHDEYIDNMKLSRVYNSSGTFSIALVDVEIFVDYVNRNFLKMNPKYPEIISVLIFEKSTGNVIN